MTTVPTTELPVIRSLADAAPVADDGAQIRGDRWRITVLTDGVFRVEWSDDGAFEDRASSFAIRRRLPSVDFTAERVGDGAIVTTERARLRFDGHAFSAEGFTVEIIGRDASGLWRYGADSRDLGGTARTLDDVDGRTALEGGVVARDGIAAVDDSTSFLFDDDGWLAPRETGRRDVYVFAHGRDFDAAIRDYYAVSGAPALLPRWALGNWWSRYNDYSAEAYLALMDRFDDEGLPFSVAVIDMDWHRVGSVPERHGNGWTGYSWEPELFPDPEGFLAQLRERGLHSTLNLHPADGVRPFEDAYPAMARALGLDPAAETPIPFTASNPAFLRVYFSELHHPLEAQGVDFWWIDWQQGTTSGIAGVDPLWVLNHFHHLDAARNGGPGMTFSRYAGPGSHRYAVGFSGDAVISWASLAFQPEFTATAANIGYGWWSHDIGGHTRGVRDDELATRWVQFGIFSPIMRLHSANNPFIRKEPWQFPTEYRAAMGEALRFRHRLVPYLHSMNHRAVAGAPLVRPIYYLEPRRPEAFQVPHEYSFGSELIVAPITEPRDRASLLGRARTWLPPGIWSDIFTGSIYRGDRFVELHRSVASIPALLKAGGILPLASDDDLDATRNPRAIEILVAPGASGTFTLIEDPEDEADHSPSARTQLAWDVDAAEFRIGAATNADATVPPERRWTVTFLARPPHGSITVGGRSLQVTDAGGRFSVTVDASTSRDVVINLPADRLMIGRDPLGGIRKILADCQAGNPEKLVAWEVVQRSSSAAERIAELVTVGLPESIIAAVTELLATVGEGKS